MKKVLAIVTLFSFIVAGDMGLIAYGGLNLTNISYEESCPTGTNSDCSMRTGLSLGVNYSKPTLPVILGVGISMRGNKMETTGMKSETKFMYLDLSAIYPYPLGPGGVWAGIDIGMPLKLKGVGL